MIVCLSMERHSRQDKNGSIKALMGQRIPGSIGRGSPEGRTEAVQSSSLESSYYWLLSGLGVSCRFSCSGGRVEGQSGHQDGPEVADTLCS